jgi:hypothetical protein
MRGMVAAAEYGGRLSATQVEIIRSILGRIFAKDYDPENIVDACRALWGYGEEVATYLFNAHPRLTLEFRRNIVRASANVINSGYPPDKEQRGFLLMIYRALQLPEAEFVNDIEF